MSNTLEKLKTRLQDSPEDLSLLSELENEHAECSKRLNNLEELLIMIVRTGWPWDEDGVPNAIFHASRDGFATAMEEARELLGLQRSRITRTEPKT